MKRKVNTMIEMYRDEKTDCFSQYRPLQKFIDRLVFIKLKYAVKSFCSGMTPELLQAISPRLSHLVYSSRKVVEIKFKLLGDKWPPQIIYSDNLTPYRVIGFSFREIKMRPTWRFLFTDHPVKKPLPKAKSRKAQEILKPKKEILPNS